MDKQRTILVASSSRDRQTTLAVVGKLRDRGCVVLLYETDKVVDGSVKSSVRISKAGEVEVEYDGQVFSDATIDAAWFRRPSMFNYERQDRAESMSLEKSARHAFENIWDSISRDKWLNSPSDITRAQHKLTQFASAQTAGLKLPGAIMSTSWEDVRSLGEESIMKLPSGGALERSNGDARLLYTTRLDAEKIDALQHTSPFPGLFEPYITKKREWRITIVGERVFAAAIYTNDTAKDDWRKHQTHGTVAFREETPEDTSFYKGCFELMRKYNLSYGAFDFIETDTGEMIFLEVNPNGQYMWLEHQLGLSISEAIAAQLIDIATRR